MQHDMRKCVDFYFDYVSPYAYLAFHQLQQQLLSKRIEVHYRPVLFAGLLKHWGQKGPAEVSPKREFTYRQVLWLAKQQKVALQIPTVHPFNPLPLLRLTLAQQSARGVIEECFRFVWQLGHTPQDDAPFQALLRDIADRSHCDPVTLMAGMQDDAVKQQLRDDTERAIAAGVFGVPSFVVDGRVYFGQDSLAMMLDGA